MNMHQVFLSVGTNMGDRMHNTKTCLNLIAQIERIETIKISPIYETTSWGFESDPFLNLAMEISTDLNPQTLLKRLQNIEKKIGRSKNISLNGYEDRLIDIDILFCNDLILNDDDLTLPHPHIQNRKFVLEPLQDIAPNFIHPILNKSIQELNNSCSDDLAVLKL